MFRVSKHSPAASKALLMMSRVAFLLFMAAECVAPPPQVREVVLRVVRDVYREEGISIRHLGSISNLAHPEIALLESVFQTPPLQMMNFSAARKGGVLQGPEEPAWTVGLHDAFVGYEGLVFDRERAFDPDAAWESSIRSPEGVTFHACSDKPRPAEEEGSKGGALEQIAVNWGMDWPGSDFGAEESEGATWVHKGEIITLLQRSSHAYYHFLCETLPKLVFLSHDMASHPDAYLLVDTSFGNTWTVQLLDLLGVPSHRVLIRDPKKVYHGTSVFFSRPIPLHSPHPSLLAPMAAELRRGATLPRPLSPRVWAWEPPAFPEGGTVVLVRRTPKNNQHTHQHQVCTINGKGCRVREATNMDELHQGIAAALPTMQVVDFDSGDHSMAEQIAVFERARAVVGAHGAGLANVMFCRPGSVLLELLPQTLARASISQIFWHVAMASGLQHATFVIPHSMMEKDTQSSLHNFRIPVKEVTSALVVSLDPR